LKTDFVRGGGRKKAKLFSSAAAGLRSDFVGEKSKSGENALPGGAGFFAAIGRAFFCYFKKTEGSPKHYEALTALRYASHFFFAFDRLTPCPYLYALCPSFPAVKPKNIICPLFCAPSYVTAWGRLGPANDISLPLDKVLEAPLKQK